MHNCMRGTLIKLCVFVCVCVCVCVCARARYMRTLFLNASVHTKLIGAFAWEQISDFLGKIEKTVHSGAIFPVQP